MAVRLLLDGVDLAPIAVWRQTVLESTAQGQAATSFVAIRDVGQDPETFILGKRFTVDIDGGQTIYSGYLMNASRRFWFPVDTPDTMQRLWFLTMVDINVLFNRRVVFKESAPGTISGPKYPDPSYDDDAIDDLVTDWLDLSADDIDVSSKVSRVSKITAGGQATYPWQGSMYWGQAMASIASLPAAIFYLDPDRRLIYADVDDEDAPFALSDLPAGAGMNAIYTDDFDRTVGTGSTWGTGPIGTWADKASSDVEVSVSGGVGNVDATAEYGASDQQVPIPASVAARSVWTTRMRFRWPDPLGGEYPWADLVFWDGTSSAAGSIDVYVDWSPDYEGDGVARIFFGIFAGKTGYSFPFASGWTYFSATPEDGEWAYIALQVDNDTGISSAKYWSEDEAEPDWQVVRSTAGIDLRDLGTPYLRAEIGVTDGGQHMEADWISIAGTGNEVFEDAAAPTEVRGYRESVIEEAADLMVNDYLARGFGKGQGNGVYRRLQDQGSIDLHDRWQDAHTAFDVYKQKTIDRIAETIVYGSRSSKRGRKDDRVQVKCVTYADGLRVGQRVRFINTQHDFDDILPIRSMRMTFPTPSEVRYELKLSHDYDAEWGMYDAVPYPKPRRPPGPQIPPPPEIPGLVESGCVSTFSDDFDRVESGDWGVFPRLGASTQYNFPDDSYVMTNTWVAASTNPENFPPDETGPWYYTDGEYAYMDADALQADGDLHEPYYHYDPSMAVFLDPPSRWPGSVLIEDFSATLGISEGGLDYVWQFYLSSLWGVASVGFDSWIAFYLYGDGDDVWIGIVEGWTDGLFSLAADPDILFGTAAEWVGASLDIRLGLDEIGAHLKIWHHGDPEPSAWSISMPFATGGLPGTMVARHEGWDFWLRAVVVESQTVAFVDPNFVSTGLTKVGRVTIEDSRCDGCYGITDTFNRDDGALGISDSGRSWTGGGEISSDVAVFTATDQSDTAELIGDVPFPFDASIIIADVSEDHPDVAFHIELRTNPDVGQILARYQPDISGGTLSLSYDDGTNVVTDSVSIGALPPQTMSLSVTADDVLLSVGATSVGVSRLDASPGPADAITGLSHLVIGVAPGDAIYTVDDLDVTGINGGSSAMTSYGVETFSRTATGSWGPSEFLGGQDWTIDPASSPGAFSVDGTQGVIDMVDYAGGDPQVLHYFGPFGGPIEVTMDLTLETTGEFYPEFEIPFLYLIETGGSPYNGDWGLRCSAEILQVSAGSFVGLIMTEGRAGVTVEDATNSEAGNMGSGGVPGFFSDGAYRLKARVRMDDAGIHGRVWDPIYGEPTGWQAQQLIISGNPDQYATFDAIGVSAFSLESSPVTQQLSVDNIEVRSGRDCASGASVPISGRVCEDLTIIAGVYVRTSQPMVANSSTVKRAGASQRLGIEYTESLPDQIVFDDDMIPAGTTISVCYLVDGG